MYAFKKLAQRDWIVICWVVKEQRQASNVGPDFKHQSNALKYWDKVELTFFIWYGLGKAD